MADNQQMLTPRALFELARLTHKARPDVSGVPETRLSGDVFINDVRWNPEIDDSDFVQLLCFAEDVWLYIAVADTPALAVTQRLFWSSLSQENRKEIYCQKVLEMLRAKEQAQP